MCKAFHIASHMWRWIGKSAHFWHSNVQKRMQDVRCSETCHFIWVHTFHKGSTKITFLQAFLFVKTKSAAQATYCNLQLRLHKSPCWIAHRLTIQQWKRKASGASMPALFLLITISLWYIHSEFALSASFSRCSDAMNITSHWVCRCPFVSCARAVIQQWLLAEAVCTDFTGLSTRNCLHVMPL